ncbi:hypothetical protein [Sphingobacterium bovistauri]|uniref:Lipoprotein n=1 Tax=Sphingobacterium bovistauri TaxID=2781959 RepID=A0ABS7Z8P2_9SPHI|nr:hypothetical protein [Sphingobacterium bovistauri]MCA5005319.1 hypothetical protein [Sphingobacterium bovistauri]
MKKIILLGSVFAILASCQNSTKQQTQVNDSISQEMPSIGGNKDKHGCLSSAGQTWSQIKNDCIQVFSVGIRLNPVAIDSTEAIISAFVVPNTDSSAFELFLADNEETVILNKQADDVFSHNQFKYNKKTKDLSINDKIAYKSE